MHRALILSLLDYMYWVNHRLLDAAEQLTTDQLTAPAATTRDLRATLVHELDVEWSWRLALEGRPIEELGEDVELRPEDYPDVASIRQHWQRDEAEMRGWLEGLDELALEAPIVPALADRSLPTWQYLLHIVMHAAQQQADAATLLSEAGSSPGELGYLEYVRATGGGR